MKDTIYQRQELSTQLYFLVIVGGGADGADGISERRRMFPVQIAIDVGAASILVHVDGCTCAEIFQCGPRSVNSGLQHEQL